MWALLVTLAVQAASWSLGQLLGQNCGKAGYSTPQAMVTDFAQGEDELLAAMACFICSTCLAADLRAKRWAGFARGYNGPGYAANRYDTKLAAAYRTARANAA